jgi:mycofactocin precursor
MDNTATATLPAPPQDLVETSVEQTAVVEEDLLVEDVSIDGMCGVY